MLAITSSTVQTPIPPPSKRGLSLAPLFWAVESSILVRGYHASLTTRWCFLHAAICFTMVVSTSQRATDWRASSSRSNGYKTRQLVALKQVTAHQRGPRQTFQRSRTETPPIGKVISGLVHFANFLNPTNNTTFVLFDKYYLIVDQQTQKIHLVISN